MKFFVPCEPPAVPSIVLDPFAGSGTTLAVAVEHGRRAIGCELNPDYLKLIEKRMHNVHPRINADLVGVSTWMTS